MTGPSPGMTDCTVPRCDGLGRWEVDERLVCTSCAMTLAVGFEPPMPVMQISKDPIIYKW